MINKIFKRKKIHLNGKGKDTDIKLPIPEEIEFNDNFNPVFKEATKKVQAFEILTNKKEIYKYVLAGWLITTVLLCAVIVYQFFGFKTALAAKENQLFVIHDQKVYEAQKDENFSRSEIEIDMFVRTWLANAFSYDKHSYENRISMALEWMDKDGADAFYRGSEKSNTQNRLNNYNANTAIAVDSLRITRSSDLSKVEAYFNWQTYINGDLNSSAKYKLISNIKPVRRTTKHPYAMILTNTQYHKMKTKK